MITSVAIRAEGKRIATCATAHIRQNRGCVSFNHREHGLRSKTMTTSTLITKITGMMIGTGVFVALGTAMAHAEFCFSCM